MGDFGRDCSREAEVKDLIIKRKFDPFWEVLSGAVSSGNRELDSGEVLCCVILSPTRFGKSSTSLRGDKLLPRPCDQALTTQTPGWFGVCCFSIISLVSTVKQKPSVMFPCPLSFTSPPPVPPSQIFPQPVHLSFRTGRVCLAFIPRADGLSAGLGIFVPRCAEGHKRCPPADKLCWIGIKMI